MMPISTQTEGLLNLYNQKIELDQKQLGQVTTVQSGYTIATGIGTTEQIKVWGPSEVIENYNYPIQKLDNRILELNNQIAGLETELLNVGQTANNCGCGGSVGFSTTYVPYFIGINTITVYQDSVNYKGYTFSGTNPFAGISGTINTSNLGIGTETKILLSSIGVYYGNVGVARTTLPVCPGVTNCAGYATSITNLTNSIVGLQSSRDALITKVNFLKAGRCQYELQNYAYNQSTAQLNSSIGISSTIIGFLQDPNNAEWL